MKKILLLLIMGVSLLTFSQNAIFHSKYMEMCKFNYEKDDYVIDEEMWIDVELTAYEEYCILLVEGEEKKMWWEFNIDESDDDFYIYYTENHTDKIVFDDSQEEIYIFFEYNSRKEEYEELIILSKITLEK